MNEVVYDLEISSVVDSNNLYFKVPSKQLTMNRVQWQMDSEELLSFNFPGKRISPALKMHTENSFIQLTAVGDEFYNLLSGDFRNVSVTSLLPENIIKGNPGGQISGSVSYYDYGENSREINSDLIFSDLRWSDLDFNNLTLNGQYKSEKPGDWTLEGYSRLDSAEFVLRGEKPDGGNREINAELQNFPLSTAQPFVKEHLSAWMDLFQGISIFLHIWERKI